MAGNTTATLVRGATLDMLARIPDKFADGYVDLARADTRAGVHMLESAGLLAAGRALEILDAPIQALEV